MTTDELHAALTAAGWHDMRNNQTLWERREAGTGRFVSVELRDRHINTYAVSAYERGNTVRFGMVYADEVMNAYAAAVAAVAALPELR